MFLNHLAISCITEENSDRFYRDLLGLDKIGSKTVPAEVIRNIFSLDREFKLIKYSNNHFTFEVFITEGAHYGQDPIGHVCLEVADRKAFLERCEAAGAAVSRTAVGESVVVFIRDFDGNRLEIKESADQ